MCVCVCVCELLLLLLLLLLALVPIIVLLSHSCVLFFVTNTFSLTVAVKMWYHTRGGVRKKHNTKKKEDKKEKSSRSSHSLARIYIHRFVSFSNAHHPDFIISQIRR